MRAIYVMLSRTAVTEISVLLEGETGTGKELAADAIHSESPRRGGPFVVVDCGALQPHLIESELFGHEEGAFTSASRQRVGAFEKAGGGTLFLDEIGELPLDVQPTLLRAVEAREIRRVGGEGYFPIDVRIVSATRRDLRSEVNAKRFRGDLYFRLAGVSVAMPPLGDRMGDLPLLISELLSKLGAADPSVASEPVAAESLERMTSYSWPGNVRELRNYIARALAFSDPPPLVSDRVDPSTKSTVPLRVARQRYVDQFERDYLEKLLAAHDGNVTAAATAAGVNRVHLHRLIAKHRGDDPK